MNKHTRPSEFETPTVTTGPLPASRKVYTHPEADPSLAVPRREIDLHPSAEEPPVPVYDTSGPYSDPDAVIDVEKGLARHRTAWVLERAKLHGGVEEYEGRDVRPEDNGNVSAEKLARAFPVRHRPLKAIDFDPAKSGAAAVSATHREGEAAAGGQTRKTPLTQYEYAVAGIITKEMVYVAERENLGRQEQLARAEIAIQHGESFGADIPAFITPEFVRDEIARGRAISSL